MNTSPDYPRVRASGRCPLCGGNKLRGQLACTPCINVRGIGAGDDDPWADKQFARAERALESAGTILARKLDRAGMVTPLIR